MTVNIEKLRLWGEVLTARFNVLFLGRLKKIIISSSLQKSQYFSDTLTSTSSAYIIFCPTALTKKAVSETCAYKSNFQSGKTLHATTLYKENFNIILINLLEGLRKPNFLYGTIYYAEVSYLKHRIISRTKLCPKQQLHMTKNQVV
jgi:hypothetical protein